jgi:hypothetical protein
MIFLPQKALNLILELKDNFGIRDARVHQDGTVSVPGSVCLTAIGLKRLPCQFNVIDGDFLVSGNELESMHGFPRVVKKDLIACRNHLNTLVGGPVEVGGYYLVDQNPIRSFEGVAKVIGGILSMRYVHHDFDLASMEHAGVCGDFITDRQDIFDAWTKVIAQRSILSE